MSSRCLLYTSNMQANTGYYAPLGIWVRFQSRRIADRSFCGDIGRRFLSDRCLHIPFCAPWPERSLSVRRPAAAGQPVPLFSLTPPDREAISHEFASEARRSRSCHTRSASENMFLQKRAFYPASEKCLPASRRCRKTACKRPDRRDLHQAVPPDRP